jgi:hypothetical protein
LAASLDRLAGKLPIFPELEKTKNDVRIQTKIERIIQSDNEHRNGLVNDCVDHTQIANAISECACERAFERFDIIALSGVGL